MPKKRTLTSKPNLDFIDSPQRPSGSLKRLLAFEAWGILVLVLTIVYILGVTGHGGPVGAVMVRLVKPVVGRLGALLLAFTLLTGTVHLMAAGSLPLAGRITRFFLYGLPLALGGWECGMRMRPFYWDSNALKATGYVGLWLGRGLRMLVGDAGLGVAVGLLVVLAFIVLRISPRAVRRLAWQGVRSIFSPRKARRTSAVQTVQPGESCQQVEPEPLQGCTETEQVAVSPQPDHLPGRQLDLGLDEAPPLPRTRQFKLPSLDLLAPPSPPVMDEEYREFAAQRIVKTLETFGIPCHVSDVITGPAVTRVEVVLGEGIRVKQVEGMEKDIAYTLPAKRVRVEAPIPGKTAIGIEFPNIRTNLVRLKEVLVSHEWNNARAPLTIAIAKNLNNQPVLADLGKMPHLLVAGQTGSGKSVCLHAIILSLLYRLAPDQLRLILIDPKMVEFGFYEGLPHLLTPVVNDVSDAVNALRWSVQEMRDRYRKLKSGRARDIVSYNRKAPVDERMPFIVIIIDEMSDLMAQEGFEIEACITSLTQLARAVGIHLILATQRPSVKIITGNIKGNIPARIALNVASYNDSRTILDYKGAESLLGCGDMLFKPVDEDTPIRAQGVLVDDEEVKRVVEFLANQGRPEFDDDVTADHAPARPSRSVGDSHDAPTLGDQVVRDAIRVFLTEGEASTSLLQSKLKLGYPRARRLMTELEGMGLVGPKNGSRPREIIYSACREALASADEAAFGPQVASENNVDQILSEV